MKQERYLSRRFMVVTAVLLAFVLIDVENSSLHANIIHVWPAIDMVTFECVLTLSTWIWKIEKKKRVLQKLAMSQQKGVQKDTDIKNHRHSGVELELEMKDVYSTTTNPIGGKNVALR